MTLTKAELAKSQTKARLNHANLYQQSISTVLILTCSLCTILTNNEHIYVN
jgi:hypothetical protein